MSNLAGVDDINSNSTPEPDTASQASHSTCVLDNVAQPPDQDLAANGRLDCDGTIAPRSSGSSWITIEPELGQASPGISTTSLASTLSSTLTVLDDNVPTGYPIHTIRSAASSWATIESPPDPDRYTEDRGLDHTTTTTVCPVPTFLHKSLRDTQSTPTPSIASTTYFETETLTESGQPNRQSFESYSTAPSTRPSSSTISFATCTEEEKLSRTTTFRSALSGNESQGGYATAQEDVENEKTEKEPVRPEDTVEGCGYPEIPDPEDPARILGPKDLRNQRIFFFSTIVCLNIGMAMVALFANEGLVVFCFILFIKSKDFLSVLLSAGGLLARRIYRIFKPLAPVPQQWILTIIPAYSESEEQIVKTIYSLRDNDVEPHRQVMVVLLDGKPRDVRSHMTRFVREFQRPYVSLKHKRGVLKIIAGFMQDVPVIVIEKLKNSGKKDSLILCHDLFNVPRHNVPLYTTLLRNELWADILPKLTEGQNFTNFDMVFCTDADSTIYKGAVASLANALARDKNAIAACGLVLVELEPGFEWQVVSPRVFSRLPPGLTIEKYTFGQYVRRRAEGFIGKVTCLPGCITMIAVREEMAGAIRKYAEPITIYPVIHHQVQYLGTDRRLTYSMLSQDKKLHTLFVPGAVSETVAPQSLQHYLSQRRRWGSNAYFNNYFYWMGEKARSSLADTTNDRLTSRQMIVITRIAASVEVIRLSMVYYRIFNTALFLKGLTEGVTFMELLPLIVVSQLPTMWFMFSVFFLEHELRKRAHKLLIGFCINKMISPFISITVFTKVAKNLGSQVWGMSGVTASSAPAATSMAEQEADKAEAEKKAEEGLAGLQPSEEDEDIHTTEVM
ncbi:chitin synthase-domain-containing protein [Phyllosticta capitalensis]|uniref:chitin synthase-domain-containing protein n=1 Tax=Phyllosticta capitalensis TaxID=121624 RepID=UPI003131134E